MELHLLYGVLEKEDIITRSVIIKNAGKAPVTVKKAQSACLDFLHGDYDLIKFYGRHAMERNMERMPVSHESTRIGSRRGTSSHQYNPGVILAGKNTNEDSGSCYGMLFVYSGNFLVEAEKDQYDQTRIQMGLHIPWKPELNLSRQRLFYPTQTKVFPGFPSSTITAL